MIIIASENGRVGIVEAMHVLRCGGSALDAVETGIRLVEDNAEDETVGVGGLPNLLGVVQLDASIMDGRTRACGAVGAVRDYAHPITIARRVMEELPHVFLVGEGAERFAAEIGAERRQLLTEKAAETWRKRMLEAMSVAELERLGEDPHLRRWVGVTMDPRLAGGTVNFIAQDAEGNIACGVSTSGWAWKYPGRLGDSPVIGAGNYADNRYGAAACTGLGEMTIRAGTARSVVLYMQMGMDVEEACCQAMKDLQELRPGGGIDIIALDRHGRPAAVSNEKVGGTYVVMTDEMDTYEERPRTLVPPLVGKG
ncbi:MAG: N(4)-(beta-N-acetylglucosaminyl)-L-asparaginase [Anaerolineae bacterium]|jgi:beta-aspartyl-peptidase (threonine type)|nr:N(4)-(beta-N-acetylglucosaminyl)-L-asparaginase [Anaerolineae bacterium]MDH7475600.1 N(4)-(beta-N-acetylglucosaminyl)-L-asparaginase [Anaerolineae bacterium]